MSNEQQPNHNRRIARQGQAQSPTDKVIQDILVMMNEYAREAVAAGIIETKPPADTAGDIDTEPPAGSDPLTYVRDIAAAYAADAADDLDSYLDRLADELTLDDLRALRLAGEAAKAVTPRVVMDEVDRGTRPRRIADELGLTQARVYAMLAEQRKKRVQALVAYAVKADADSGGDPRVALARYSAALADVPEEHREAAEEYLETLRSAVARHRAQQDNDG